ncbi:MAG TPA: hypothetical protein VFJ98_09295 [Mycobacteriales bacterium]|nr:hypothetical protein [Mycobacteriales bacterium]
MRRCRRAATALVLTVATLLLSAAAAAAHNGAGAAFKGRAGHYTVYAYDGFPAPGSAIIYRVVLLDRVRARPAYDVHLTGTAVDDTGTVRHIGPGQVQVLANVAYLTLPNPYPGDVRIRLQLAGRAGRAAISFRMHGLSPQPIDPTPVVDEGNDGSAGAVGLVAAGGLLVVALVALVAWVSRRAMPRSRRARCSTSRRSPP